MNAAVFADAELRDALEKWCPKLVVDPTKNTSARLCAPFRIMLHYDASAGSDASAIGWFHHPLCDVSYDVLNADDGRSILLNPNLATRAAWHAGVGLVEAGVPTQHLTKTGHKPPRALPEPFPYGASNHAYIGVSVTTGGDPDGIRGPKLPAQVTTAQAAAVTCVCCALVEGMRLDVALLERDIVGHEDKAILNPKNEPDAPSRWGQLGRKNDPTGDHPARPILSVLGVRYTVRAALRDAGVARMYRELVAAG
jgi:hypothetical protein